MQIAECNEPIASNIRRIITEKGLKQSVVAARANFSANAFSAMVRGRKLIKPCDVNVIARALGVSVNELYKKGDEKSADFKKKMGSSRKKNC